MNIRHVLHNDIDKEKWEACVKNADNSLVYAWPFYLDIMSPGWDALVMDDYEAVMPLTGNKKWGISYLRQPAFTQQSGIFGKQKFDKTLSNLFLKKAVALFPFIEISLNYANEIENAGIKKCNLILPLNSSFDEIKKAFRKDLVSKAINAALQYSSSEEIEMAIQVFRENYAQKLAHINNESYENLYRLCIELKSREQLLIRKVNSPDGKLLTISILFKDTKRIYYILAATVPEGRSVDSNAFLLHEIIKEFSGQNLLFDFEGSDIPSIQFFFKKFGAIEQPYHFVRINQLPFWKKIIKKWYDAFKYSNQNR